MKGLPLFITLTAMFFDVALSQSPEAFLQYTPASDVVAQIPGNSNTSESGPAKVSLKRPGHYTARDWTALIDSLWGPGLPTATKLDIFDTFWGGIDREYTGFPFLNVNWDSLRSRYRPEVEAGVSRGRFAGIMGQLCLALQDMHAAIEDVGLDSVAGQSVHDAYVPGAPLLWVTGWHEVGNFGAALTPMPDSSLLVYRTVAGHPLGLVPGDIVLGYDGIPWKQLARTLLEIGLPIQQDRNGTRGSSPRSWTHGLLASAGKNWGLFDTIDVVKYATGDTLHLPTAPLAGQAWNLVLASDQLEVPGVRMPNWKAGEHCTWGVVENTTVGYIYTFDWFSGTGSQFAVALSDLLTVKKVSGLIIDSRHNRGGTQPVKKSTLDPLFNFNPAGPSRWRTVMRSSPADHFSFLYCAMFDSAFQMLPDYYDRPIAFLTGPHACSGAELIAFQMRSHPMVRFFGLPTSGAYPATAGTVSRSREWGSWNYLWYQCQPQSLFPGESYMNHKSFPVDEEVWLTREGVVNGEDDVVKRALQWINTLAYVHGASVLSPYVRPGIDTLTVRALLTNPSSDSMAASLIVRNLAGVVQDSSAMMNDGLHADGSPGDSVLGVHFSAPSAEGFYSIDLRTRDHTIGSSRFLPAWALFTTAGPVSCVGDTSSTLPQWGLRVGFRLKVSNNGAMVTTPAITGTIRSLDTAATVVTGSTFSLGDITPEQMRISGLISIAFDSSVTETRETHFELLFSSNGTQYWRDTLTVKVHTVDVGDQNQMPTVFALEQNYPNPFNPKTVVSFQLPVASRVRLVVYDLLGREVKVLMEEKKEVGKHEVTWDAGGCASGVYICRMTAGDFVDSKKLLLVR